MGKDQTQLLIFDAKNGRQTAEVINHTEEFGFSYLGDGSNIWTYFADGFTSSGREMVYWQR